MEVEWGLPLEVGAGGDRPSTRPPVYFGTVSLVEHKLMFSISREEKVLHAPFFLKNAAFIIVCISLISEWGLFLLKWMRATGMCICLMLRNETMNTGKEPRTIAMLKQCMAKENRRGEKKKRQCCYLLWGSRWVSLQGRPWRSGPRSAYAWGMGTSSSAASSPLCALWSDISFFPLAFQESKLTDYY